MSAHHALPTVPSPCIQVCQLDTRGVFCIGCLRTLEEIAAWQNLNNEQKTILSQQLVQRRLSGRGGQPL